ncbi:MAG: hypothetical protein EZS26_002612 [Candidatus Ordinivivax streblomastigis]|uniref:DUF4998 domain-containing protein n=1 Tax=Candidatus Ordinivivax streblomastigis TaxID=2540710 RepID=A0A5M8NWX1_9BACT|nr:MAG: hypothetical protein EZS26_002612 [Candidatus Ordinivivax streblomastigis]
MKKIIYIIISIIVCLSYSCSDMLDNIRPYLDEGETIYVGKLIPIAFPGKNRAMITGILLFGQNQVQCTIRWRNPATLEEEVRVLPIERHQGTELVQFLLENLEEGQYDFSIITQDAEGNTSIPTTTATYVYGEQYEATLVNRNIKSFFTESVLDEDGEWIWVAQINWIVSRGDGIVGCYIKYDLNDGGTEELFVPVSELTTELTNYKANGVWEYKTAYLPDELSLDTFYTQPVIANLPDYSF